MQFSLFFFAAEDLCSDQKYRLLLESAKFADRNGFAAVWTPERHFERFGGPYPNPAVTSAAVAVITQHIQIRAGGVVLPLHDPIRVAEDFAVVDNLSHGRVEIACVTGSHPNDFAIRPNAYANREMVLRQGITTIQRLWRGERLQLLNGVGRPVEIEIFPKPVQRELVVWRVCNREASCRWAGENGFKILTSMLFDTVNGVKKKISAYRTAWAESQPANRKRHVALMVHVFVGKDARAMAWPAYCQYLEVNLKLQDSVLRATGREVLPVKQADREFIFRNAFDRLLSTHGLIGSPEQCAAKVQAYREMGVDEIACLIDFGIDPEAVLDSLSELSRLREICR